MSSFTSALIAVPTLINIAAIMWLLWYTSRRRGDEKHAETTGHVWDGNLTEYNKPLPRWWLGLFIATVVFGLVYLVVYPGLGNYGGTQSWSQIKQYEDQSRQAEAVLARTFAPYQAASLDALQTDTTALRVGRNLFLNNCAGCHGSDGRGAPGFPNLADRDWLYGGDGETVLTSIRDGRTGVMPAWGPVLGNDRVENVLTYVMSLSGRKLPAGDVAEGKKTFGEICAACHGADGHGNKALGAPDLTDQVWLNGGALATIRQTIAQGRQGQMPAHLERLGEARTKLLAAYVLSLGEPAPAQKSVASATTTPAAGATVATPATAASSIKAAARTTSAAAATSVKVAAGATPATAATSVKTAAAESAASVAGTAAAAPVTAATASTVTAVATAP